MTLTRTPLKRKTPLKAKTPLKRTPFKRKPIATKNADDEDAVKTKKTTKVTKPRKRKTERQKLVAQLDKVFSEYIRMRDAQPHTGYVRCFSCGRITHWKSGDCGHFVGRSAQSCRWREDNCHFQDKYCNIMLHGNLLAYRRAMVAKYGEEHVRYLEVLGHTSQHFSIGDLEQMLMYYTALRDKVKEEKGL